MSYHHECTGCAHCWTDSSKYYSCPWCGEPCTNESAEDVPKKTTNRHAAALGKLGGKARADILAPAKRSAIATIAARALWQDHNPNPPCTCKGCKTRKRGERQ